MIRNSQIWKETTSIRQINRIIIQRDTNSTRSSIKTTNDYVQSEGKPQSNTKKSKTNIKISSYYKQACRRSKNNLDQPTTDNYLDFDGGYEREREREQ